MIYWTKQPSEQIPKTIDFTDALPTGETLDGVASAITAADEAGTDVSADLLDDISIVSPNATVTLLADPGGESELGEGKFTIRFLMVTTPGAYVIEEDVTLVIREK